MGRFKRAPAKPRGLAAASPETRRAVSRKGGKRVQALGLAPHFDTESGKFFADRRWRWERRLKALKEEEGK